MTFEKRRLSHLARIKLGKMLQSDPTNPEDVEADYLRAAHVQPNGRLVDLPDNQRMWFRPGELESHDLRVGDVVIVEGGAGYGRSAVVRRPLAGWGFQNSIIRVRPIPARADGRFLDYALQGALADGRIPLVCSTATIPHFTAEKTAAFSVPAPPVEEQRAIASFLDRETAKIDTLIEKQINLREVLQERRLSAINTILARVSGAPGTPLRTVVDMQTGVTLGKRYGSNVELTEYPYLRVANVQTGQVDTADLAVIDLPREAAEPCMLRAGDVLITEGGDRAALARGALWNAEVDPCLHQNHIFALRPKPKKLRARYLVYVLEGSHARQYFERTRRQTTNLSATNSRLVRAFRFTLPTLERQDFALAQLDRATAKIDRALREAEQFVALARERRAALINAAVTGQIDVREMVA